MNLAYSYFDRFLINATNSPFMFDRTGGYKMPNIIIRNNHDVNEAISQLTPDRIIDNTFVNRENTSVNLISIYAVLFRVLPLDAHIGRRVQLPQYLKDKRSIIALDEYNDNLCFWRCMAIASGRRGQRCTRKAKELFRKFYEVDEVPDDYPGFDYINELDYFEALTNCRINIMSINEDDSCDTIRDSPKESDITIYLNLYLNHFSYIVDLTKCIKDYRCRICLKKCQDNKHLELHVARCTILQEEKFPQDDDNLYRKKENIIYELCESVCSPEVPKEIRDKINKDEMYKYDYLIIWDIETLFRRSNPQALNEHIPYCISLASNVEGYREHFLFNKDPVKLVDEFFEYLESSDNYCS